MTLAFILSGVGIILNFYVCIYALITSKGQLPMIPFGNGILLIIIFFAS